MKNTAILIITILVMGLQGCNSNKDEKISTDVVKNPKSASGDKNLNMPVISFERDVYDFGKLIDGEKVTYHFKFKNTGDADLLISQVNSSCGCTVPKFPRKPVPPGGEGSIEVTFDSSGRSGVQNKTVTVVSNCQPNNKIIRIKAMVVKP